MNDREQAGLRGQVRACVLDRDCVYPDHHRVMRTSTSFSREGNLLRQDHQNPDGSGWSIVCHYDDQGRILGRSGSEGPFSANWALSYHYDYDALGRLERVVQRSAGGVERVLESYRYEATGRKILTEYLSLGLRKQGIVVGLEASFQFSAEASFIVTFFDEHDRPVKRIFYDPNDRVDRRILFRYDAAGRLLEEGEDEGKGRIRQDYRQAYTYDTQGRILSKTVHHYAFGTRRNTFLYNDNGDVAEERYQDSLGILGGIDGEGRDQDWAKRFQYVYDGHGNWTERTETRQSAGETGVSTVERRSLEYY
ncbi:MAG: hypothetical protein ACLQBJ_19400 [Bryobacteraceae bacterium]